jgi:hypothetical protein
MFWPLVLTAVLWILGAGADEWVEVREEGASHPPAPPPSRPALERISAANASEFLNSNPYTMMLLFNSYCADCERVRSITRAAAELLDVPGGASRFAEVDTTEDKALLRAFEVGTLPTLLVYRSADHAWWPYRGAIESDAVVSHMARVASSSSVTPACPSLQTAADVEQLRRDAESRGELVVFVIAPQAPDESALQLFRNASSAAAVHAALPAGGVRWAFLAGPELQEHFATSSVDQELKLGGSEFSFSLLRGESDCTATHRHWHGASYPSDIELVGWLVHVAAPPALLELTPHAMNDVLLESAKEANQSLLVVFCAQVREWHLNPSPPPSSPLPRTLTRVR